MSKSNGAVTVSFKGTAVSVQGEGKAKVFETENSFVVILPKNETPWETAGKQYRDKKSGQMKQTYLDKLGVVGSRFGRAAEIRKYRLFASLEKEPDNATAVVDTTTMADGGFEI